MLNRKVVLIITKLQKKKHDQLKLALCLVSVIELNLNVPTKTEATPPNPPDKKDFNPAVLDATGVGVGISFCSSKKNYKRERVKNIDIISI